jgi:co-chaperonin GroES (HSP10)
MDGLALEVRGQRVLIRAEDQRETQTEGGLIAVSHHAPDVIGTVMAVGDDVIDVKRGDVVLFTPESGQVMEYAGSRYLVLTEDELLAVWDEEQQPV